MHKLQGERFYKSHMVNRMMAAADGPIKTFPLRGVKACPLTFTMDDFLRSKTQSSTST